VEDPSPKRSRVEPTRTASARSDEAQDLQRHLQAVRRRVTRSGSRTRRRRGCVQPQRPENGVTRMNYEERRDIEIKTEAYKMSLWLRAQREKKREQRRQCLLSSASCFCSCRDGLGRPNSFSVCSPVTKMSFYRPTNGPFRLLLVDS
jgi:hypothetical protein